MHYNLALLSRAWINGAIVLNIETYELCLRRERREGLEGLEGVLEYMSVFGDEDILEGLTGKVRRLRLT